LNKLAKINEQSAALQVSLRTLVLGIVWFYSINSIFLKKGATAYTGDAQSS